MRSSKKGDSTDSPDEFRYYRIRGRPVIRFAENLLKNQAAETVGDERDVTLCQSGLGQKSWEDIVCTVHQGHGVTEPLGGCRIVFDAPDSQTWDVVR